MTVYKSEDYPDMIVVQCSCWWAEHEMGIAWLDDLGEFSFTTRLCTWRNVFQRMWHALKYVLGHKSRFGAFDEILVEKRDARKIARFLLERAKED